MALGSNPSQGHPVSIHQYHWCMLDNFKGEMWISNHFEWSLFGPLAIMRTSIIWTLNPRVCAHVVKKCYRYYWAFSCRETSSLTCFFLYWMAAAHSVDCWKCRQVRFWTLCCVNLHLSKIIESILFTSALWYSQACTYSCFTHYIFPPSLLKATYSI